MNEKARQLKKNWDENPRWRGVVRTYSAEEVVKLQGTIQLDHTLARIGAAKLWDYLSKEPFIRALGAETGCQAVQQVQAGLKAIYVSGWQVAADMNDSLETYPDLSLYPVTSVPHLIRRINKALMRQDQIDCMQGQSAIDWFAPIVADAEAGFGGPLNTFELIKAMIEEGVSAVHLEDQLSSLKKCGHMGGKVLEPASIFIHKLIAARFAADILDVPTLIIARTDAEGAKLIRSDSDPVDKGYITGNRSPEGYFEIRGGIPFAIERAKAFAPYADLIWCETQTPSLEEARAFAEGVHQAFPGKWLAYNCSPSFNWKKHMDENKMRSFQEELGKMGYKFQFITLAGFHTLNASMFDLASQYASEGMSAYGRFQESEFQLERERGFKAIKHQQFVGASYFDEIMTVLSEGQISTKSMEGSTESAQFTS
ncbi:isocitrate lyase [Estrella lausannensis]|uniref:Isocitrate lyase n=1 Tax=Estrella lausannensis TaxID=483423 RepID=A0A0H5DQY3_9BACT|nr:isocitrate lyase [Estrella lausannensis]CRX38029.1 Isocitrate lyase [Estrella lausannensis]